MTYSIYPAWAVKIKAGKPHSYTLDPGIPAIFMAGAAKTDQLLLIHMKALFYYKVYVVAWPQAIGPGADITQKRSADR